MKTSELDRLKELAGLSESLDDIDDGDDKYAIAREVETRVSKVILQVFLKVGIPVSESRNGVRLRDTDFDSYAVSYDYDSSDADAIIDECTVAQLIALNNSGLGTNFALTPTSNMTIRVTFNISPSIVSGAAKLD